MNKSFIQLVFVHIRNFYREPSTLFWAIGFPVLMAWVLGIAFSKKNNEARPATVYIVGSDSLANAIGGERLIGEGSGSLLKVRFKKATEQEAITALKKGVISVYLDHQNNKLTYHFDPSNPEAQLTHLLIEREVSGKPVKKSEVAVLTAKGTRYIDFLIPGLMAFGIMNSCLWGISWGLIETRMKKLLRRMIATPMKKPVFLLSTIFTRVLLSIVESGILFLFSFIYFGIELTGSVLAFLAIYIAGIMAFSGIGILIASRTSNSQTGNGLINAVTLPMTVLSGVFFNYHTFPEWTIPFIQSLPLTMLGDGLRSVFIEGAGLYDVLLPLCVLSLTGILTFLAGLKIFKWY